MSIPRNVMKETPELKNILLTLFEQLMIILLLIACTPILLVLALITPPVWLLTRFNPIKRLGIPVCEFMHDAINDILFEETE